MWYALNMGPVSPTHWTRFLQCSTCLYSKASAEEVVHSWIFTFFFSPFFFNSLSCLPLWLLLRRRGNKCLFIFVLAPFSLTPRRKKKGNSPGFYLIRVFPSSQFSYFVCRVYDNSNRNLVFQWNVFLLKGCRDSRIENVAYQHRYFNQLAAKTNERKTHFPNDNDFHFFYKWKTKVRSSIFRWHPSAKEMLTVMEAKTNATTAVEYHLKRRW